jgi:hypothetical protein
MAKDNAAMLLALGDLKKPKGASAEPELDDEEAPKLDLKGEAAADAFAAVKADDSEGFAEALERFVSACMSDKEAGEY